MALPVPDAAPPGDLTLTVTPLVSGGEVTVRVTGATPNTRMFLFRADQAGAGAFCPPLLSGDCLDLVPPVTMTFPMTSDAAGEVEHTFTFPRVPPRFAGVGMQVGYQTATGIDTSNAVQAVIHQADSDADGDGLTALDEVSLHGTDPGLADSDGGGTPDGDELILGGDPTDSSDDAGPDALLVRGMDLYAEPLSNGNSFACSSCHALQEPAADGIRRPGHAIGDAVARSSWKNGQLGSVREAVNTCQTEWMNAPAWTDTSPDWLALQTFLESMAPATAPDLSFNVVQPPANLSGGDALAGQELFNESCVVCHGIDGAGTLRAPPVVGFNLDPGYVATRIRTSGRSNSTVYPSLTGGLMPFWAEDRLSDPELRDLVAYLEDGAANPGDTDTDIDVDTDVPPSSGCGDDHPRVGQTADFVNYFHGIGGEVEIIDNCTAEIRNFTYDGRGIIVEVYGRVGGQFTLSMSDELVRPQPYLGETIYATLPAGQTWSDVDALSIWCVAVGIDFGSAILP